MKTVAVVTGGSSGIGKCTAAALAEKGCVVYELSRRDVSEPTGVIHITADITDDASVANAITRIIDQEGHIDILINNAGSGISGAVEFTDMQEAMRLFEVNFFGMVRVTKEVLPHMRKSVKGRVVNISSVAAVAPIPFQTFYSASKAAINAYTMATANEVSRFGISVCAVMPGDIRSGFTDARKKSIAGDDVYGGRIAHSVSVMEKDERGGMAPEKAGRFIARVSLSKKKKPLYTIGIGYKCIAILIKILPAGLVNRLIKLIYA